MEKQKLNPTIVYVLAIVGLLCCCFAGSGFILSGVAFIIAHNKIKQVQANPEDYDVASVKAMNTAKTVALVILIINVLYKYDSRCNRRPFNKIEKCLYG